MNATGRKYVGIVNAAAFALAALCVPLASAADDVRVLMPQDVTSGIPYTAPASKGFEYVTVPSVHAHNPSHYRAQGYDAREFHLLIGDTILYPVERPKLGALDFTSADIAGPGETTSVTVTFLVPIGTETAQFEFLPHWQADDGATVDFCCLDQ
ncbi:MAG TPA: hypothetical protein VGD50_07915 [Candidatus Baltobacteraceae bacterium]